MATREAQARYHHGALKAELLRSAEAVLVESGVEAVSLREVARRAGVSHAAPAHHFRDLSDLLAELAAVGFTRFTAAMEEARAARPAATSELLAIGRGYLSFATQNPDLFRLMFQSGRSDKSNKNLCSAGAAAFAVLERTMAAIAPPGPSFPARLALAWSTIHGLVLLMIDGRLDPVLSRAEAAGLTAEALIEETLLMAFSTRPRPSPSPRYAPDGAAKQLDLL